MLNINVGILGHVDAGKTSLVRALSTELSTAALDKNPQSQERGITLDLGFSAFATSAPPQIAALGFENVQFTLVDCPGHASLIRTVIGGAQIIDTIMLVVDIVKGIQTQTAECLVLSEITTESMIVVLNKVDMLPLEGRAAAVERMSSRIRKVLQSTRFASAPFVVLSAAPAEKQAADAEKPTDAVAAGAGGKPRAGPARCVADLVKLMLERAAVPARDASGPFLFAVDHCFPIKGQGTVLTGTVLAGACSLNDVIELPDIRQDKKVKSMQMFRRPVSRIQQGDRAGICVASLDASLIERGLACTPGAVPAVHACVALVKKIRFFKGDCATNARFHITVGHATVMASVIFFGAAEMAHRGGGGGGGARTVAAALESAPRGGKEAAAAAEAAADADAVAVTVVEEFSALTVGSLAAASAVCDARAPTPPAPPPLRFAAATPAAGGAGITLRSTASTAASHGPAAAAASSDMAASVARRATRLGIPATPFVRGGEFEWQETLLGGRAPRAAADGKAAPVAAADSATAAEPAPAAAAAVCYEWQWAALLFDAPVLAPLSAVLIGSHLDADVHGSGCRLAFYGRLAEPLPSADPPHAALAGVVRLFKRKVRVGAVDRIERSEGGGGGGGGVSLVGAGLFAKGTDMGQFAGLELHTRCGQRGLLEGAFGRAGGKFKAAFADLRAVDLRAAAAAAADDPRAEAAWPPRLAAAVAAWRAGGGGGEGGGSSNPSWILTLPEPPPIRAGDPLFLRYRKYMLLPKDAGEVHGKLEQ